MRYALLIGLVFALSSCASIRQHTKDIFLYQQTIVLAIADILFFDAVTEKTENELYDYEEQINKNCGALQSAAIQRIRGEELSMELMREMFDNLDVCERSVQNAEMYLVSKGFRY